MALATAVISFEAPDVEAARATVASWTLSEGCTVNTSVMTALPPSMVDAGGNVVDQPPPPAPGEAPPA